MKENIFEDDPNPWINVQQKIFPRSRQASIHTKQEYFQMSRSSASENDRDKPSALRYLVVVMSLQMTIWYCQNNWCTYQVRMMS